MQYVKNVENVYVRGCVIPGVNYQTIHVFLFFSISVELALDKNGDNNDI